MQGLNIEENERVHFECEVEPKSDPDLKVYWTKNGQVLQQGSRFKHCFEFGRVTLDIMHSCEEDSGVYVCVAENSCGVAKNETVLRVKGGESIVFNMKVILVAVDL